MTWDDSKGGESKEQKKGEEDETWRILGRRIGELKVFAIKPQTLF